MAVLVTHGYNAQLIMFFQSFAHIRSRQAGSRSHAYAAFWLALQDPRSS